MAVSGGSCQGERAPGIPSARPSGIHRRQRFARRSRCSRTQRCTRVHASRRQPQCPVQPSPRLAAIHVGSPRALATILTLRARSSGPRRSFLAPSRSAGEVLASWLPPRRCLRRRRPHLPSTRRAIVSRRRACSYRCVRDAPGLYVSGAAGRSPHGSCGAVRERRAGPGVCSFWRRAPHGVDRRSSSSPDWRIRRTWSAPCLPCRSGCGRRMGFRSIAARGSCRGAATIGEPRWDAL